jgi:SIR2-like domain
MILVIFGAGASYDSVPSRSPSQWVRSHLPDRPPLANELFSDIEVVKDALDRFPECHPIISYLQNIPDKETIETVLEDSQSEGNTDVVRKRQLAAIRFYLQLVIWEFERRWRSVHRGITNYVTLLDQVRRARRPDEPVCIVTFNYDRMIEDALRYVGITIAAVEDCIKNPDFKLFKLHGSVNWGRRVKAPFDTVNSGRGIWDVIRELIQRADEVSLSSDFEMVSEHPIGKLDTVPLFPALQIPVTTKRDYECPDKHLECLKDLLPQTRTILTIGWRGMENHFLDMLAQLLAGKPLVGACAIAGGSSGSKAVLSRLLQAGIPINPSQYDKGFTEFAISRRAETFCETKEQNSAP